VQQHRQKRARGSHGASPLSAATRKRLLAGLLHRAETGDVQAAAALIWLSMERAAVASGARCPLAAEAPA